MEHASLNLARKWRSKNFSQIVGQKVSVRILKNSLYLGHYFPVYLFAGQRGCGKTSTARVFAAALNCQKLFEFQKNPQKNDVPCQECSSCVAMVKGKHPDFIEVDGASHAGVDNVRNIIEASTLMPVMGRKKIYLIDEAHMLSKASFNAFLKILEEPPEGVLFILATTAPDKIIDTVRSRCFQLFFNAIDHELLCKHLQKVCDSENIAYEIEGLRLIVRQSEGSARDALNILEQVRFSHSCVDVGAILKVLGHIDDAHVVTLLRHALLGTPQELLQFIDKISIDTYSAYAVWQRLIVYARALLWFKHGVVPTIDGVQVSLLDSLQEHVTVEKVYVLLQKLYEQELILGKTKSQHALLEMALLHLNVRVKKKSEQKIENENKHEVIDVSTDRATWDACIVEIKQLKDPLLFSIFSQGTFVSFDLELKKVSIEFGKNLMFFNDYLVQSESVWLPIITRMFGPAVSFDAKFTGLPKIVDRVQKKPEKKTQQLQPVQQNRQQYTPQYKKRPSSIRRISEPVVDVSNASVYKMAHTVLEVFPGTITEVQKS